MRYKNAIIALGVLIAVTLSPFIGVPRSWKEGVASLLGLLVSVLAYVGTRPRVKVPVEAKTPEPRPVSTSGISSNPQ